MSETGFPVGVGIVPITLAGDGATETMYIKQETGVLYFQINSGSWNIITGAPIYIQNTNATPQANILKVIFSTNITITDNSVYFICASDGIQFGNQTLESGGSRRLITVSVDNYDGLIQNGTETTPGYSYIYVYNLEIDGTGHTLQVGAGWVGMKYYGNGGTDNYIVNCRSSGAISDSGGGIVGEHSGENDGYLYIYGCSSSGIIGFGSGGMVGNYGAFNGHIYCEQCFSTGEINLYGGGIFGFQCGIFGYIRALRCYSTGAIIDYGAGGIFGTSIYNCIAENCYSTGAISGDNAGGIFGSAAASCQAINCYTLGNITGENAGGIFGPLFDNPTALHNYVAGSTSGPSGYIFGGSDSVPPTNYSEAQNGSSGWTASHAQLALTGTPLAVPGVGSSWASTSIAEPYEIASIGYTPYSLTVIDANTLVQTYSQTIEAGESTIAAINADASGNAFAILQINGSSPDVYAGLVTISQQTGAISTTASTEAGTYTIVVRSIGSYNITTFILTVTGGPEPTPEPPAVAIAAITCCAVPMNLNGITYDSQAQILAGNIMIEGTVNRRGPIFYSDILRRKMAKAAKR